MQAQWAAVLDQDTIPTSLLVLTNKNFPPLDSVPFMECQLHTMKIKYLNFEPHACRLSFQAYKHWNTCRNITVFD